MYIILIVLVVLAAAGFKLVWNSFINPKDLEDFY